MGLRTRDPQALGPEGQVDRPWKLGEAERTGHRGFCRPQRSQTQSSSEAKTASCHCWPVLLPVTGPVNKQITIFEQGLY